MEEEPVPKPTRTQAKSNWRPLVGPFFYTHPVSMATMPESGIELARRSMAYILLTEVAVHTDKDSLISFLSEVLADVIHRLLRKAAGRMALANRAQMSIFDLLSVLPVVRLDVHKLLSFLGPRMNRQRSTAKVPPVISLGRNMLRASGDDDDEEVVDQAPRPGYLTDIYPPLPRAYTYRRTETKGVRESDKVLIAKAKAEQQRQVESNLYRLLLKTSALKDTVNFENDFVTQLLDDEVKTCLEFPLEWAPSFGCFEPTEAVAQNLLYRQGKIVPMDPSSSLAVSNLELASGDHVLDLCCAPGGKMVLMSEQLRSGGSITGVDISRARLAAASTMAKKYKLPRLRLLHGDGTTLRPLRHLISEPRSSREGLTYSELYPDPKHRPVFSSSPYRKQRGLLAVALYDKVLVDAQCTHDGSIKHIRKHIQEGWANYNPHHYSPDGLQDLYDLQLRLLENGFGCLKSGGILVYSTCSLSKAQNEGIIHRFVTRHADTALILDPIGPDEFLIQFESGSALCVVPTAKMGGGFFVCRIRKL